MWAFVTGTVTLGPSPSPIAASPLSPRGNCLKFQFIYICHLCLQQAMWTFLTGPISHVPSPSSMAASPLSPRGNSVLKFQ